MALLQRVIRAFLSALFLVVILMTACAPKTSGPSTPSLVPGDIPGAAAAQTVVTQFLLAWQEEDYSAMYNLLSSLSRDAISPESFESEYRDAANSLTLESLSFQLLSAMAEDNSAEVACRVDYDTRLAGNLTREIVISLVSEMNTWRIQWERGLILPELADGNRLLYVRQVSDRGRIFDKGGAPLAAYEDAIAIGIVPGELLPDQSEEVFQKLAQISIYDPESLRRMVESTPEDWYLPVVSLSQADARQPIETLRGLHGVRIDEFRSRFYVDGGVAPHALGYMLHIPEEALDAYLGSGYSPDDRIGVSGLEAAYETVLSGRNGGSIFLVDSNGVIQTVLAAGEPQPGQSLTTTLDKALQMWLQASLGDLRAAVVVLEVDTGRVLALVSNPHFDPNAFDLTEIDRSLLESYFIDEDQPLFNRATQGQYPLGSVFKTITMAAALEEGLYSAGSSFVCGHRLWVCDSVWLEDWTLGHGVAASGELTLTEGLMRSCNPWFYRIGEDLFTEGKEDALSDMAYGFGLDAETGIEISEASGHIPESAGTCVDSAQIAIGQGEVLVTPLQVAVYFAALANGGTLYRPTLVEHITPASGEMVDQFKPEANGKLPISPATLTDVLDGLRMVIEEPRGTGHWAMEGLEIRVSGKTGTAETPSGLSHAWFAGFTRQNDPQHPDIAVAVIVENSGEGSVMAAPVFRRVVSLYFSDNVDPGGVMPWEVEPYETAQPAASTTPTLDE